MFWLFACATPPPLVAELSVPGPGPGARWPAGLGGTLVAAWRASPQPPRTRHLASDGTPRFVNRLVAETSPYLRQHAHNPVDWRPWGSEALAEAAATDRPIFLSVGYATCHWCHVMEEESFEDPEIARLLNSAFVPIKVDREERPDIDAIYMTAVQTLSGRGGWPMTVVATPDGHPFFATTYLPPRAGDRGSRTGLLTALRRITTTWETDRGSADDRATRLTSIIQQVMAPPTPGALPGTELLVQAASTWYAGRDEAHGGLKGAPKFPSHLPIRPLLRAWRQTGDASLRTLAHDTLTAMARSGMRDQLGGGFHRYSTDAAWRVPHFEIMAYDQGLLALDYIEGWRATGDPELAEVAREILAATERDLRLDNGLFGSALDADSLAPDGNREEGRSYTWTLAELENALGADDAAAAARIYGVTEPGNLEGRSVLHRTGVGGASQLAQLRSRLLDARAHRPRPLFDDKAVAGWNGLLAQAFAEAALAFDTPAYAAQAERTLESVLRHLRVQGRLRRTWRGHARHPAAADDLAFVAAAAVSTFEATGAPRWLHVARSLHEELETHYATPDGGWFQTPDDAEALLVRAAPVRDGAVPSANSIHPDTLLRLASLTGEDTLRARADEALEWLGGRLEAQPSLAPHALSAVGRRHGKGIQVVLVVPEATDGDALRTVWRTHYLPDGVFVQTRPDNAQLAAHVPVAVGKPAPTGEAMGYVCQAGSCRQPTSDPVVFGAQLTALTGAEP